MIKQWIGRTYLKVAGWHFTGVTPTDKKFVIIAAPHTSNWDLPHMIAYAFAHDVRIQWMGKHTLFRWPMGPVMRALGGIPIERHKRGNTVEHAAQMFLERDRLALVVPAEGTRSYRPYWKSGFYYIARAADVPVCLSYLDFGTKRGGFGPMLRMTGNVRADMDKIRAFYADKRGLKPELQGEIRLREEDQPQPDIPATAIQA